jgi:LacI family transcriptional regulator
MEMLANGSIDGFIMSLSKETQFKGDFHHINQGMPVVMFLIELLMKFFAIK